MLVVADTTPLSTLGQLGFLHILEVLFGSVLIPPEVAAELSHPLAPQTVRDFIATPPAWLSIRQPLRIEPLPPLDPGEEAAINLAQELGAALLMDDKDGRRLATAPPRCLRVVGTVGVLELASAHGLLDLRMVASKLVETGFYIADEIIAGALARDAARRKPSE
jgi:predicted nucleic acid-binding protein